MKIEAVYFDGESSQPRPVVVRFEGKQVQIFARYSEDVLAVWPIDNVHLLRNNSGNNPVLIQREGFGRIRLETGQAGLTELTRAYPEILRNPIDKPTRKRLGIWIVGSLAAVALTFFVLLPAMVSVLTTYMPRETERRIGQKLSQSVMDQSALFFGVSAVCTDPDGVASLQKMYASLNQNNAIGYPVDITVLQSDLVNAFALPGGQMVILSGLINESESAEEVAAVLAHELGHVDHRHPLSATLAAVGRSSILSIVLGDVSGGVVTAAVAETLISANYSRRVEEEADAFAYELLNDIEVGTEPLAGFFDYIADEYGDLDGVWQSFSTHPELVGRAERARDADLHPQGRLPNYSVEDYEALGNVCNETSPIERSRIFEMIDDAFDFEIPSPSDPSDDEAIDNDEQS